MRVIFLDFETYYDDEYSLRKMTPVEYILDPRFEVNGCAVKEGNGQAYWLDGDQLPAFFASLDPKVTCLVTHNALFDMCIVAWHYSFIPRLMIDTLGVARAVLGHILRSVSLENVALHLGLGIKTKTLLKVKGMNLAMIKAAGFYKDYVDYGLNDVELCAGIYDKLVKTGVFPANELAVMDMVLRCAIRPKFQLNLNTLTTHLTNVKADKEQLLAQSMLIGADGKSDLMSNEKFAELLRQLGVEPPTKMSLVTKKETYAFAKTDEAFLALEEHENPAVQALFAARCGYKSTLEEKRSERLIKIAQLTWPGNPPTQARWMPIPLRFSGAHTHRLSGDWKLNFQNLPRGGELRRALIAPQGHKIITIDSSQIEARMVAWICGQTDLVEQFARGEDVYASFATKVFSFPINKKDHPDERFVGKQAVLGLGYSLGWSKFQARIKTDSKNQTGKMIILSDEEALKVVQTYRGLYREVPKAWNHLNTAGVDVLAHGGSFHFGPCKFEKQAILLPSGLKLHYHNLHYSLTYNGSWMFTYGGKAKKIYGGALLENIVQALARIVVMDAGIRIQMRLAQYGLELALQVHDELVYVVPWELVDIVKHVVMEEMTKRPYWAPGLPLAAEVGVGDSYGEAK